MAVLPHVSLAATFAETVKPNLDATKGKVPDFENSRADVYVIIGRVTDVVLSFLGVVILVLYIYGGYQFLTSAGATDKIKKGKDILIQTTIGAIIILASYAIVSYVLENLIIAVNG